MQVKKSSFVLDRCHIMILLVKQCLQILYGSDMQLCGTSSLVKRIIKSSCERYRECFENIARQKMRQSDIRNNHALYLNGKRFSYKLEFCQNQMFYLLFS